MTQTLSATLEREIVAAEARLAKPVHLHDRWSQFIGATDENYWGTEFLVMIMEKYPELLDAATGKNRAHLHTRSRNYLELESIAWRWRLYRICKATPGCLAPADIRAQFA